MVTFHFLWYFSFRVISVLVTYQLGWHFFILVSFLIFVSFLLFFILFHSWLLSPNWFVSLSWFLSPWFLSSWLLSLSWFFLLLDFCFLPDFCLLHDHLDHLDHLDQFDHIDHLDHLYHLERLDHLDHLYQFDHFDPLDHSVWLVWSAGQHFEWDMAVITSFENNRITVRPTTDYSASPDFCLTYWTFWKLKFSNLNFFKFALTPPPKTSLKIQMIFFIFFLSHNKN